MSPQTPNGDRPPSEHFVTMMRQLDAVLDELRRQQSMNHDGDRRLALHYAISHLLLTATKVDDVAPHLLQTIGEYLGWSFGALWCVDDRANEITCKMTWHQPDLATAAFIEVTTSAVFAPGEGVPGRVWASGEPLWQGNVAENLHFSRRESAMQAGLSSVLAFPIRAGNAVLGVIEFFAPEIHAPDRSVLDTLAVIGTQTGQFMERQRVEAALTTTQAHLDLILEQMPAAVIIAEAPSGRLLLGNAQVEQIWGRPFLQSSTIEDYHAWQGFHLDGRPYQPEEWPLARAVTTGEIVLREEIALLRGNGNRSVARVSAAPVRNTNGEIIAGVVIFDDITAEHQAIDRVLRLQTISAALLEALTPGQIAQVVVTQGVAALDAYAGSLLLLSEDKTTLDMIGMSGYPDFVDVQFQQIPMNADLPMTICVQTGEPFFIEDVAQIAERFPGLSPILAQTRSGATIALPLRVDDRTIGVFGLSFRQPRVFEPDDRTFMLTIAGQCALALERARLYLAEYEARQRAEAAQRQLAFLAEASELLASSLDYETTLAHVARMALPELADWSGVTLVGPDGELKTVALAHIAPEKEALLHDYLTRNPTDPDLSVGIPLVVRTGRSQLVEHTPPESFAALNLDATQAELLQTIGLGTYMYVPLHIGARISGAISFGAAAPRRYTKADLALAEELGRRCAVAIQNARLYYEAQQAIQVRDEFLTMASHELRTPLTALMGMSQMLEQRVAREVGSNDRVQRGITIMSRQATRLKKLIDQMFDLSRVHMGYLDLDIRQIDLSHLLRQVVEEARAPLQRHTIQLDCPEELLIDGDEARLEQVFQNLLHNAIKYSPDGGPIHVRVVAYAETIEMTFGDSGIGIPDIAREHVFKRFYRASNSARRNISGLGIGLYIVNEIIQRHGGSITFYSTEGQGTTFTIVLPRRASISSDQ